MLVTLSPDEVSYRIQSPVGRISKTAEVLPCVPESPTRPWEAACVVLAGAMAENMQRHMRLNVVVSDRLVRYLILPWRPGIASRAEWRAYALHNYESVYGEASRTWHLRIDLVPPGQPSLACAIDVDLIEGLRKIAEASASRLISVRPNFISIFNQRRASLRGSPLWFGVAERRSVCLGMQIDGVWRAIRNESAPDGLQAALPGMIGRMQCMAGGGNTGTLYIHSPDATGSLPDSIGGLSVRALDAMAHRKIQPDPAEMAGA
jgi:hypothetical protein